ncbi:MAG: DUF1092 family protein [Oscillatoria sp. SIO1A7]|nr:DUF1092 family protein [Oscillatoria sp. SIO1A7]
MKTTWELDFYSRPVVDENGKKVWEVLICSSPLDIRSAGPQLRFSKFCPSTKVNSAWLREAIEEAIAQSSAPPAKIRFFRRQMNNMIVKTCKDMGIDPVPSRRTVVLSGWLQERMEQVYPQEPGYQPSPAGASLRFEAPIPEPLPDALEGEQWAFVSLSAGDFDEMNEWAIDFSEAFPIIGENGLAPSLTPDDRIPGVIIFSRRALALAAWISGLDLAFLKVETESNPRLLLETGVNQSWILAPVTGSQTLKEAKGFAEAKKKAEQVHFLAVQSDPSSESFAGFWLLKELNIQ